MTEREQVEQAVREALATETRAVPLSNCLFTPDGLFSRLARTPEERRVLVQTPLFREALRRVTELEQKEAEEFAQAATNVPAPLPQAQLQPGLEKV